jgi:hypothetical protein
VYLDCGAIHNDTSLIQFVIPGLNRNLGCFWIPANERRWFAIAGMTESVVIHDAAYSEEAPCFLTGLFLKKMDKNATLKIVNPLLAILLLSQPFSIILKVLTGWDAFEVLHIVGGIGLLLLAAIHVMLNWGWVRMNLLKRAKKKA